MNRTKNHLTSKNYWENYYKNSQTNKANIVNVCSVYDKFWEQFIGENSKNKTLIEIGGFPGRYLAYLSSKFDLEPTCLDYNSDINTIESAFKIMDVHKYQIIQEDFTSYKPEQKYDYVLSNGFIEHFTNFNEILDLHIRYLKSGGKLLIMIPNMRGYIRIYKYMVDHPNLKVHNLKSMSLEVFKGFSLRHSLSVKHLGYFGTFPFNVHQKLNFIQNIIYKSHRILFKKVLNTFVERHPSSFYSSTIIAIFEKS